MFASQISKVINELLEGEASFPDLKVYVKKDGEKKPIMYLQSLFYQQSSLFRDWIDSRCCPGQNISAIVLDAWDRKTVKALLCIALKGEVDMKLKEGELLKLRMLAHDLGMGEVLNILSCERPQDDTEARKEILQHVKVDENPTELHEKSKDVGKRKDNVKDVRRKKTITSTKEATSNISPQKTKNDRPLKMNMKTGEKPKMRNNASAMLMPSGIMVSYNITGNETSMDLSQLGENVVAPPEKKRKRKITTAKDQWITTQGPLARQDKTASTEQRGRGRPRKSNSKTHQTQDESSSNVSRNRDDNGTDEVLVEKVSSKGPTSVAIGNRITDDNRNTVDVFKRSLKAMVSSLHPIIAENCVRKDLTIANTETIVGPMAKAVSSSKENSVLDLRTSKSSVGSGGLDGDNSDDEENQLVIDIDESTL